MGTRIKLRLPIIIFTFYTDLQVTNNNLSCSFGFAVHGCYGIFKSAGLGKFEARGGRVGDVAHYKAGFTHFKSQVGRGYSDVLARFAISETHFQFSAFKAIHPDNNGTACYIQFRRIKHHFTLFLAGFIDLDNTCIRS